MLVAQINFRVNNDEKAILDALAKQRGISVSELAKQVVLEGVLPERVEIAFRLLEEEKIGRKAAWFLSGLSYHEFVTKCSELCIVETIPEAAEAKGFDLAVHIDLSKYLRQLPYERE